MSYRCFITLLSLIALISGLLVMPGVLKTVRSNPEMERMIKAPDATFSLFSACKKQVTDAEQCYNAYSAAVYLANLDDCSPAGIELKRKFKGLVEHAKARDIENEINKQCRLSPASGRTFNH